MSVVELRDLDEARAYVLQGLWLQRTVAPSAPTVRPALEWAMEIAANGQPLPPVGLVSDLGRVALGMDREGRTQREALPIPHWTREIAPRYEDYVLGKVYADWTFERAGDALRRYAGPDREKDRRRGLAYVVKQFRERAGFTGVELPPGVIRGLLEEKPDDVLVRGWELVAAEGPSELLLRIYREVIEASRRMAELLALEDVIALEQRTALADMGQYVAHRQVLQMANRLAAGLPQKKVRPLSGRREVPTRVLDEDTYPVGGFSSISNRGTIESLLHSQLAYMEPAVAYDGPDLFDVKYVRDELYYYSRDENQFLRRRRSFVFALFPDLVGTRFKDKELPCQRGVLLLALLLTAVRKLSDWLSTDALAFEFVFPGGANPPALAHEIELVRMLLREQIENGTVTVLGDGKEQRVPNEAALRQYCERKARRSLCHCLAVGVEPPDFEAEGVVVSRLAIDGPRPAVADPDREPVVLEAEDALETWVATLHHLLQLWV
ncbi:MAG TPA: hypothetical protein VIL46_10950 [Gemmataceae bacterium]